MIRLSKSDLSELEVQSVLEVMSDGYLGMGRQVGEFEKALGGMFNKEAVCVSSGTAALQLALEALHLPPGSGVLVPSITYVASLQAIKAAKLQPVICDINAGEVTLCLNHANKLCKERDVRAIMPVHYAGYPLYYGDLYDFAESYSLRVVEDAAHAFGSKYSGRFVASFGDITCFSFDGIKNITCGEGGAVVTSDNSVLQYVRDARLLGVMNDSQNRYKGQRSWDFDVKHQGWRYHMSDIMAAIGRSQLTRLDSFRNRKHKIQDLYLQNLNKLIDQKVIKIYYQNRECIPHIFPILLDNNLRNRLKEYLQQADIQTGIHYKPNHKLSFFESNDYFPNAEEFYSMTLSLPFHTALRDSEVTYICEKVLEFFNEG